MALEKLQYVSNDINGKLNEVSIKADLIKFHMVFVVYGLLNEKKCPN